MTIVKDWTNFHNGEGDEEVLFITVHDPDEEVVTPVPEGDVGSWRYSLSKVVPAARTLYRDMTRYRMYYLLDVDVYLIYDSYEIDPISMMVFLTSVVDYIKNTKNHTVSPFVSRPFLKEKPMPFSNN